MINPLDIVLYLVIGGTILLFLYEVGAAWWRGWQKKPPEDTPQTLK